MVWVAVLRGGNFESAARRESGRVSDERATHFCDSEAKLAKLYSGIIRLPRGLPAWDVYFVFAPSLRWEEKPPPPTYWMHQLGKAAPSELRLDGDQLARVVNGLLQTLKNGPQKSTQFHRAVRRLLCVTTGGHGPRRRIICRSAL